MKTIPKRRRQEGKTDYNKRLKILKSGRPRVIIRKTNKYIIAQYVKSHEAQDSIVIGITSKRLIDYGWPKEFEGSLKTIAAAYLTGLLIGKKIIEKDKASSPIVDFGRQEVVHKSRIYAFLKGLVDSGLKIKYKEENFPEEKRIFTDGKKDIEKIVKQIKDKILKEN